jgi:hypothetical protein
MQGFVIKGQVAGVIDKETAKGKKYKVVQVLYMRKNASYIVQVKDFNGGRYERGEKIELPVFPDAWVDRGGQARVSWVKGSE